MGRFESALNVSEQLRPWYESGLEHLLVPGSDRWARPFTQARSPRQAQTKVPPSRPKRFASTRQAAQHQSPAQEEERQKGPNPLSSLWTDYWNKAAKNPKVIFTYYELGQDLSGGADPQRRVFLKKFLTRLSWPAGTTTFWPVGAFHDNIIHVDADLFWRGAVKLMAGYLACFGQRALDVVCPGASIGQVVMKNDILVYALPDLADLIAMDESNLESAIRDLSSMKFQS